MPPKEHELVQLQDQITREVNGDAAHIATDVFGETATQPDIASVPDARLDAIYRRAYQTGDRQFLQNEAKRDPRQFMKIAQRLGVQKPSPPPALPAMPQAPILPMPSAPPVAGGAIGAPPGGAGPLPLPSTPAAAPLPLSPALP